MSDARALVIHGHFYQPPRENPWIEDLEIDDSAAPFHDWNERVTAECYAPNGAARIVGTSASAGSAILDIVDNYAYVSFNVGPTLAVWLDGHAPAVLAKMIAADRASIAQLGHGNAIAQPYHHVILPLLSPRDRRTELLWGRRDFERRFGRAAEGVWLPETAADVATLEAVAEAGFRFTILSPTQIARSRSLASGEEAPFVDGRPDPRHPYRIRLGGDRTLAVFVYDGEIANAIAFRDGLRDRDAFVDALVAAFDPATTEPQLVSVATDGETFGHHRPFGDMVLAAAIERILRERPAALTNYAAYLVGHPARHEAEIQAEISRLLAEELVSRPELQALSVPEERAFHFQTARAVVLSCHREASDLAQLRAALAEVDATSLYYHLFSTRFAGEAGRGDDLAAWLSMIGEDELAGRVDRFDPIPQFLVMPSIDPLSDKNRPLEPEHVRAVCERYGIDPDRPMLVQVSRFDRFKDPIGVIRTYRMVRETHDCQLVLAGGGASDDPEGAALLAEVQAEAAGDPDIHILLLPPDANVEINALQRAATVIIQKSLREGFGLTVSEGMWKGKPVIGGATGGIPLQIRDGVTGYLVSSPEGAAFRARFLLNHPEAAQQLGRRAMEYARQNFLLTRNLRDYLVVLLAMRQPQERVLRR